MKSLIYALISFFAIIFSTGIVYADNWSFTLNNMDQQGIAGAQLIYSGVITNTSGGDLQFTGLIINSSDENFDIGLSPEFLSAIVDQGIIPPSGYSGDIFYVNIQPNAVDSMVLSGTIDIAVDNPGDPSDIAQGYSATVITPITVPESGTWLFATIGIAFTLLMLTIRQRRRRA